VNVPALERCVGDVDEFLAKHWDRSPLLRSGAGPGFDDLASFDDLDRMVSSLGLRESALRMVRDGQTLSPSSYTSAPSARSRAKDGAVSPSLVYERFEEGATIVLEGLHRYWEPLTDFCRDLEIALGHRLQVNAYITPPGSQGFDVHRDEHDVFVLQVWGTKHWIVHDRADEDSVLIDETISPGAALYIPQGFPHAATTGSATSAHLTVGILTHDSSDILKEIVKLAEDEPAFNERLMVADDEALSVAIERHVDELRRWLDKVDVEELTKTVGRKVFGTAQPILRGQLRQLELVDSIDERTAVRRRRGATCHVSEEGDHVRVLLIDRELSMPSMAADALAQIQEVERFHIADLHGRLDPESSIVLVKRLVREGLLEVVVDD
jgi:bifunctional lysine-specific demethylase and histidyl-hydroxylase NO66